jgi:hypothetical protein
MFIVSEKPFMRWSLTRRQPVAAPSAVSAD